MSKWLLTEGKTTSADPFDVKTVTQTKSILAVCMRFIHKKKETKCFSFFTDSLSSLF